MPAVPTNELKQTEKRAKVIIRRLIGEISQASRANKRIL
jgi:hypothetical protein